MKIIIEAEIEIEQEDIALNRNNIAQTLLDSALSGSWQTHDGDIDYWFTKYRIKVFNPITELVELKLET